MASSVIIIFVAFSGFLLAAYIRHKKVTKETMVCPLKSNCETVIFSNYSKFFGVPVELIGVVYYLIVVVAYGVSLVSPGEMPPFLFLTIFSLTIAAFIFSLYLTFIQAFALKQWCTWCLISAGFCTVIFVLAVFAAPTNLSVFLGEYHELILAFHILAIALGLGGATITDIFFFKFLKDFKISEQESAMLNTLSQVIWFGLGFAILTGIGLFIPESSELLESPKFLLKMIVVSVILVNGLFLNLLVSPKLIHISFGERHDHHSGELTKLRKLSFALGAVSIVSWYSAFILGMLRNSPLQFSSLLGIYLVVLSLAVVASQVMEHKFAKRGA